MVLSYYNKFDDFSIKNINPILCCLLLTPVLFIGSVGPILVVSIISLLNIYIYPELPFIEEVQKEEEDEEVQSSDEEAQTGEEEVQSSDEEEQSSDDEEEKKDEDEEVQSSDEEDTDGPPELIEMVDSYLIILTVKNKTQKYILTTTNEVITTYKSKVIELGSIKLWLTNINLIVLEIDVSEDDIEQIKLNNENELYEYTTFDDTLNKLNDVKLECIWRRYKHILSENEYKDNTYTIL